MRLPYLPLFCLLAAPALSAGDSYLLLQHPSVSKTQIVFEYAGDLWSVPRSGGDARRLTANPGLEGDPSFSPDGTKIAFTGEYDGNTSVFVMPAEGGNPKRLTSHPLPGRVRGWTPDGKRILFTSSRTAHAASSKLFTVGLDGGFPEELALPMASEGNYSPDGGRLAYSPIGGSSIATWKRYRGGRAPSILIADVPTSHVEKIPRSDSNDFNPMWVGDKIYFLSDRNGPVTLFRYDSQSKKVDQMVENHGLDLKSASAGPDAIVYEQFGSLHLYDLKTGKTKEVEVRVTGDFPELREHFVKVDNKLTNARISPTGVRAVFEARGEILTVPADKGDARNLTNTPGVMEREPAWSPDGKTIAYYSDEPGEYELHLRNQSGEGAVKKIKLAAKPGFYGPPRWSPDSKKIAYTDNHAALWYVDIDRQEPVKVDTPYYHEGMANIVANWSPDSQWITYSMRLKNYLGTVRVYSLADGKTTQITDGMSDAQLPVFDKDGKYLYLVASTDDGPTLEVDTSSYIRPSTASVYLVVLSKKDPSPLGPESDDEKPVEKKDTPAASGKVSVKIDFDNISQRILTLPLPPQRYTSLQVGKAGTLYAVASAQPMQRAEGNTVHRFDLNKRKSDVVIAGVRSFEISENGEKMLYQQGTRWVISAPKPIGAAGGGAPGGEGTLKTDALEVWSVPRAEWQQMYNEAWRLEREFFYDPNLHGMNLEATKARYQPYVSHLVSRRGLNYLLTEALSELSVGHLSVGGGDIPQVKHLSTGFLGADYKVENGRYRFARIFNGENWNPNFKAPLTQPGVNVTVGEYLLAVDGRELRGSDDVFSFFEGKGGQSVLIKVGPDPNGANSRDVVVQPIMDEVNLRHLTWVEDNRRKVDQLSNGRIAYIYMQNTSAAGNISFNRYFFAQVGKEGLILDDRFNVGGQLATDIIDYLKRGRLTASSRGDGHDQYQPQGAILGPKVMLINEASASGGDAMPWYFHLEGVGTLIGKRTWGGLVGLSGSVSLMDGGVVSTPSPGLWNTATGQWEVENHGVSPDIEVEDDPEQVRLGHDPQLERAVQVILEELKKHPVVEPKHPPFPNYHRSEAASTK